MGKTGKTRTENCSMNYDYKGLLKSPCADKWRRIGISRRAGVAVPLFSIYSNNSTGIGDINDLKLLIDWCKESGLTILQLLPLNETGNDFSPYNAISSFAIEPMYISLNSLFKKYGLKYNVPLKKIKTTDRVDYGIKRKKLKILHNLFRKIYPGLSEELNKFIHKNKYWIEDYAKFKVLKEKSKELFLFYCWIQQELYAQLIEVKKYAEKNKILLMGDLPLLVSRDSVDVWSHRKLFKTELIAGAPPDLFYKSGQLWGMPPYNWDEMEKENYTYLKERLKYAGNFFDMFRIDHFIGLFRIWTVKKSEKRVAGKEGRFDPDDEREWEEHGRKILNVIIKNTQMLPSAEDLGTVPECSPRVLKEYGICGTDWQRTLRNKNGFIPYDKYRKNSAAVISTHDSNLFSSWWNNEITDGEKKQFLKYLVRKVRFSKKCTEELIEVNLETINRSASIFSIQLMQEWLCLEPKFLRKMSMMDYRINYPGIVSRKNWTIRMPLSLERMLETGINDKINQFARNADR